MTTVLLCVVVPACGTCRFVTGVEFAPVAGAAFRPVCRSADAGVAFGPVVGFFPLSILVGGLVGGGVVACVAASAYERGGGSGGDVVWVVASLVVAAGVIGSVPVEASSI